MNAEAGPANLDESAAAVPIWVPRTEASGLTAFDSAFPGVDAMAVVLDGDGRIVAHTSTWADAARERGLHPSRAGVGVDYLAVCDAASGPDAADAARGIRQVLLTERRQFTMDYECSGPDDRRWITLRTAQLSGPGSGVLVTHLDITTVRATELAIRDDVHDLWRVVDPGSDFVFLLDTSGTVLDRTRDESRQNQWPMIGQAVLDHIHPDDHPMVAERFAEVTLVGRTSMRFRARGPGRLAWRHFTATAVDMVHDPAVGGIVVAVVDVSRELRASAVDLLARSLTDDVSVCAVATDDAGIVLSLNAAASTLMGCANNDVVGRPLRDFIDVTSREGVPGLVAAIAGGGEWTGEFDVRQEDGRVIPFVVRALRLCDPATGFSGYSYLAIDHSEERRLKRSLLHTERTDSLTGLPNQVAIVEHISDARGRLDPGSCLGVAKVSLDRFTDINTVHGTEFGDALLREVGAAMTRCVGPDGMVARVYGDVFVVVTAPRHDLSSFGDEVIGAIETLQPNGDIVLRVPASVGMALITSGSNAERDILADAQIAVDAVKRNGSGAARWYDDELRQEIDRRAALQRDLAAAIGDGGLSVAFQPVVRLADDRVVGVEALARWHHPELGHISPEEFIRLAELDGTIHELGAFVLDEACRHAARWRIRQPEEPISVAVNLSAAQLADITLVDRVGAALQKHQLGPEAITLEMTETMLMDIFDPGRQQIERLKATGVRIAIDDFGTGYSSLARLALMPIDVLKVDRAFVTGMGTDPRRVAIVRTIVELADAVGAELVAEGVETSADALALHGAGCRLGQGYLWSPAVSAQQIDELLEFGRCAGTA